MNMYEKTVPELGSYIIKRFCMLIAKLTGFKSICLVLTTVLLCLKIIDAEIWLRVMLTVICTTSGLRVMDSLDIASKVNRIINRGMFDEKNTNDDYASMCIDGNLSRRTSTKKKSGTSTIITNGKARLRKSFEEYQKE